MPEGRLSLVGLSTPELEKLCQERGEKGFRGRQIAEWIYGKAAQDWEQLTNIPKKLIESLRETHDIHPLSVAKHMRSTDDVDKLLVHRGDEQVYECVLLPYENRVSCCLSSQVGCPMACTFCATGLGGFDRNLDASEIVAQYLLLQSISPRRISRVVFMGMGEPLLNYDQLLKAIRILHEEVGVSLRHITVSTVGLAPQVLRLAKEGLPIHLALSLHSPIDEIRSGLMPVNQKWPVKEVIGAMREYQRSTGRKITLEYLLIQDVNDSVAEAELTADLVRGTPHVVNLIPFNYVDTGRGFSRPSRERVIRFRKALEAKGANVTERIERGHDIAAACGQLAGQHKGRFAQRRSLSELPLSS